LGRRFVAALALAALAASCTASVPAGTSSRSPAPPSSAGSDLEKVRARGVLVVAIRVEAPPANRGAGDPAHAQKRAFELAVATLIASKVLGPNAKVELRSVGGDRLAALDQGADIVMTVDTTAARDRALVSAPYAGSAIVLAAKTTGPIKQLEDVRGRTVAVAMDELGARDVAQAYLQERAIAATLDTYMGVSGAATAVDAGKAAALIGDKIGVAVAAADRGLSVIATIAQRPYIVAVRKSAPELATAINEALRTALAAGQVRDAATTAAFPYEAP
jgi:ABC-type amino acid transport substrate-binding protein